MEQRELAAGSKALMVVQREREVIYGERAKQEETTKRIELQCRDIEEHNKLLKEHLRKLKEDEGEA